MALPYIDEQQTAIEAPPEATWAALVETFCRAERNGARASFARLLGCDPASASGAPGRQGSTVPGFRVAESTAPSALALRGRHHFSDYSLDFEITEQGGGSALRATTHAAFPGLRGEMYKSLVIRSRAHHLVTRRLLGEIRGRAERGEATA